MLFRAPLALLSLLGFTATASPITFFRRDAAAEPTGCSDISFKAMSWVARAFDFHASYTFTTPAHQNSWGYASFELFNPATQATTHCEAASNQLSDFFYGTVAYKCNDTRTTFDYSRPANQLRINQTWVCTDQDPQYPITFSGRGEANLTLECTDTTWENPNWEMGQIYSSRTVQCKPADSKITATELTAIA